MLILNYAARICLEESLNTGESVSPLLRPWTRQLLLCQPTPWRTTVGLKLNATV